MNPYIAAMAVVILLMLGHITLLQLSQKRLKHLTLACLKQGKMLAAYRGRKVPVITGNINTRGISSIHLLVACNYLSAMGIEDPTLILLKNGAEAVRVTENCTLMPIPHDSENVDADDYVEACFDILTIHLTKEE